MEGSRSVQVVLIDGEARSTAQIEIDVTSPLLLAGQSLFETMRVYPGGSPGLFRLDDHIQRLISAAERLNWPYCPSGEQMGEWVRRAALMFRERNSTDGRLRLTVAWTKQEGPPRVIVVVTPYVPLQHPAVVATTAVMIPWTGDEIAKVGSRFLYAMAEAKAKHLGADEALLVDREGRPVEGAKSNLFVATSRGVITPPLSSGPLAGIARRTLIEVAGGMGVRVWERPIEWEDIQHGAPFLTNALWGVRPVSLWDGRPTAGPQEIVARLKQAYDSEVARRLAAG